MSSVQTIALSLSQPERKLLPYLKGDTTLSNLLEETKLSDAEIKRGLMWLENRKLISTRNEKGEVWVLGENGTLAKEHGLPEVRIAQALATGPKLVREIAQENFPQAEIMATLGLLKKNNLATLEKTEQGMKLVPTEQLQSFLHSLDRYLPRIALQATSFPATEIAEEYAEVFALLGKRKDFVRKQETSETYITVLDLGRELITANIDFSNVEEQLTDAMLKDGSWKEKQFRSYDVEAPVPKIRGGRRHPYREALNRLRDVYLAMGFQEMTGPWVETAFWCMDAMWIPQDHPARDEQDTFFIGKEGTLPEAFVQQVKAVHETGADSGSKGHGSPWNPAIAKQLILRTHSTATTFRMFGDGVKEDGKYFYIANVFRNEAVDATHLAEFLQAEGFVIGDNLTLADLMGFIKEFYGRLGIHKIRFKPTYNPYTEPSLEAHYYDEKKGKWYALINSGIFRPESLYPFGIKKTVIAWGMGASRVASLLNHKNNLRELVGPQVDLHWIAEHTTPQADLEK